MPRLGAILLATILKQHGYDVTVFVEDLAEPNWPSIENSDLVCISSITSTAPRAYHLAKKFTKLGIPVIMGGAHATFMPDEALQNVDYVIRGEGEYSLHELLQYPQTGRPSISSIKGLSYKDNSGTMRHNPPREFIHDLDSLPVPDFSLVHNWKSGHPYPVSLSRGCPCNCTFCSVIGMFGKQYRCKSIPEALRELRHAKSASTGLKFIVDDNFAANKTRSREILSCMIADRMAMQWSAQVRTDVSKDPQLLRLMADAGCHILHIGFESINPGTLAAYNKKQDKNDIISCIQAVHDHGIHIHGMFVIGADTDTLETIQDTVQFATENRIDTIQIMILTPLPGTPLFSEMEKNGRLLHTDWSVYDVQHVVFKPLHMSPAILQTETFRAMGRFYSWKYILNHLLYADFHYTMIWMFGKTAVAKTLRSFPAYIEHFGLHDNPETLRT